MEVVSLHVWVTDWVTTARTGSESAKIWGG